MARTDVAARLRQAIVLNDLTLVQRLLRNNPAQLQNPNFHDKSNTSLHLAAQHGHRSIAECLVALGHDCTHGSTTHFYSPSMNNLGISVNTDGHCPLHLAAMHSKSAIVELLCREFPSSVNRKDNQGRTPLHLAASAHVVASMVTPSVPLIKSQTKSLDDTTTIEILLAHGANVNAQDDKGNTCLHYASAWGNLKAVRALVYAGGDPICSNYAGWTPEYYSITVQAEVYFRNLVGEWEKRRAEERILMSERRARGGGGLRLVSDTDESEDSGSVQSRSRADSGRSEATTSASSDSRPSTANAY